MEQSNSIKNLFCKTIPLLDPIHYLLNNYSFTKKSNPMLPSNYNFNTIIKVNDMNNMAYIDVFFSFLVSKITFKVIKTHHFPVYYGSCNGFSFIIFDISEDIDEFEKS